MTIENHLPGFDTTKHVNPEHRPIDPERHILQHRARKKQAQPTPQPFTYNLSVVIPTRNERDNIRPLLGALSNALGNVSVEVIFVDDSDDDTPEMIRQVALDLASPLLHVHVEHRPKGPTRAGGLATAVVLGMQIAQATYVAVIDADLQHPPEQLRVFYEEARAHKLDFVLASRYIKGGGYQGLDGVSRLLISVGLKTVARLCFPEHLWRVSDPLGGFFLLRRSLLNNVTLRPVGYKILMEVLLRCQWQQLVEVPYHFQARANGQSKASLNQGLQVLRHIWRLFCEVPSAGRVWKISALMLLNIIIMLALFFFCQVFPGSWWYMSVITFSVTAYLNLLLINRAIFPRKSEQEKAASMQADEIEIVPTQQLKAHHIIPRDPELIDTMQIPRMSMTPADVVETQDTMQGPTPPDATDPASEFESQETSQIPTIPTTPTEPETLNKLEKMQTLQISSVSTTATKRRKLEQMATVQTPAFAAMPVPSNAQLAAKNRYEPEAPQPDSRWDKILSSIAMVAAALALGAICFTLPGVWVVVAALLIGFSILSRNNIDGRKFATMLLAIVVGISSVDYLTWRIVVTNWTGWWTAIPLLLAELFGALHTLGFQYTLWPWMPQRSIRTEDPTAYPIYVFIPTVNEGVSILEPTLKGAIAARDRYLETYPDGQVTIVVCNDGFVAKAPDWQEAEELAKRLGVLCITRTTKGGAKAGNIENARQQLKATGDALLVIFDADQVAKPDFLLKTVPHFADARMGWVQTGQYYGNLENPVSRWSDDQQAMFYNLLCPGKAALNTAFICGTNVVLRAKALDQIGGLPQDSVTEDFAASISLHSHWRSVYLTDVLAIGLGPLDVPSYLKQQRRWAMGTLGVLRTHWRDIFLPKKGGLSLGQRVQYFLACTHYICGLRDLIYLVAPILFIITSIPAVRGSTLDVFLWHFLPYWIASMMALWYSGRGITGLRGIIIGFGSFPVLLESLLSVVFQRKIGFTVTSKQRGTQRSWNFLLPYIVFLVASLASLVVAALAPGKEQSAMLISAMWVVYSIVMLSSFLWLNILDMRYQAQAQRSRREESNSHLQYASRLHTRERGLRPVWNLGLALLLACIVLTSGSIHVNSSSPTRFVLNTSTIKHPYMGISLPVQLLNSRPPQLEQQLKTHFAIVGRTQDVHDLFDSAWANNLAAQHARPWITLEFGVVGPHGTPPIDASLAAIANGVQDDNITRWAQSIRDYGSPVYLTILLHVDRNWSLSSAVANGGIPQDAPRAWKHVRTVFQAVGATNVAWVWAPADPAHDRAYAPPASSIDAVLLSLISYPQTQWTNPETAISAVEQRYPGKPLIVEASADGPADQKAAWLTQVGDAVTSMPGIYALLYHEGAPGRAATYAENQQWSMLSDPGSQATIKQIITTLNKK